MASSKSLPKVRISLSNTTVAWLRITRWLSVHAPAHADALNSPATEDHIGRIETQMAINLPTELKQILLINNGSTANSHTETENSFYDARGGGDYSPFPSTLVFNDIDRICSLYAGNRQASISMQEPGSLYEYWKEGWIPVFRKKESHSGLLLDASGGQSPAPLYAYEEESFPELAFQSLTDYLDTVADALEGIQPFTVMGNQAPHFPVVRDGLISW